MNLSKTSWLILSVGIFVVILAGLGLTRSQQLQAKSQLDGELSIAETRLIKLGVEELRQQQAELQARLDESEIQLNMAEDEMSRSVESDDVIEEFFQIAQSCGVQVNGINCSGIRSGKLNSINCFMTTLSAGLGGELSDIINFVIKLNSDFTTGVVQSAQISIAEDIEEGESGVGINMIIYTYEVE